MIPARAMPVLVGVFPAFRKTSTPNTMATTSSAMPMSKKPVRKPRMDSTRAATASPELSLAAVATGDTTAPHCWQTTIPSFSSVPHFGQNISSPPHFRLCMVFSV